MKKFNILLDEYIKKSNLTGKRVGELAGVSTTIMSMYRRGKRVPSSKTLTEILNVLELTTDEKKEIKLAWTLTKGDPTSEKEITKISDENTEIKKVLENVEKEVKLMEKIRELEEENEYLRIYSEIFKDMTDEEFKLALTGIKEKIISNAVENKKLSSIRGKISLLEKLISEL